MIRLKVAQNVDVVQAIVDMDSYLMVQQVNGAFDIKQKLQKYQGGNEKDKEHFVELALK